VNRFAKTDDFKTYTRDKTLTYEVSKKEQIIAVARKLLDKELPLSIRLMGLRVAKLRDLDAVPTGTIDSVRSVLTLLFFLPAC
jgi:hypothetical protein